jgi:hypothetical protein
MSPKHDVPVYSGLIGPLLYVVGTVVASRHIQRSKSMGHGHLADGIE